MSRKPDQRKTAVAVPRVQWALACRVILHFFVFVCAGGVFGVINQFLIDPFGGVHKNLITFMHNSAPILLALICLIPVFVRDTLTLTNKVAGPIHNLHTTVRRLADGEKDVPPLRFRKGDFWDDLPDNFNAMTKQLRESASDARAFAEDVKDDAALVEV